MGAQITAVNVVHEILPDPYGDTPVTAIDKRPVRGPGRGATARAWPATSRWTTAPRRLDQALTPTPGRTRTGGPDAWPGDPPRVLRRELATGGLDVTGALIGERWRLGDGPAALVVQVTVPRIPCEIFARWMDERQWVKRFAEPARTGAYLRVWQRGARQPRVTRSRCAAGPATVSPRVDASYYGDPAAMRRAAAGARAGTSGMRSRCLKLAGPRPAPGPQRSAGPAGHARWLTGALTCRHAPGRRAGPRRMAPCPRRGGGRGAAAVRHLRSCARSAGPGAATATSTPTRPPSCGPGGQAGTPRRPGGRRGAAGPAGARRGQAAGDPSPCSSAAGPPPCCRPPRWPAILRAIDGEFGLRRRRRGDRGGQPGDRGRAGARRAAAGGVTRVSFGMQSAVPHVLAVLDRAHEPGRVRPVRAAGRARPGSPTSAWT